MLFLCGCPHTMPRRRWRSGVLRPAVRARQRRSRSPVITRRYAARYAAACAAAARAAAERPVRREPRWWHVDRTTDLFTCWVIAPKIDWLIALKKYATPHPVTGHPLPLVSRIFKHNLLPIWQSVARRWYNANWWRFFNLQIMFNEPGRASLQQRLTGFDPSKSDNTDCESRARQHRLW